GISLTVARVDSDSFAISAIPHTVAVTVLADRKPGDTVNLETDIIGKYVEKLLQTPPLAEEEKKSGITRDFLTRYGF
ncbi:MAG: riboflavin synthase, partial [Clostridiales bacterium]|nr:riboflavin synthase [Clostridiales bacterium]